jgi:hypothetical protein
VLLEDDWLAGLVVCLSGNFALWNRICFKHLIDQPLSVHSWVL